MTLTQLTLAEATKAETNTMTILRPALADSLRTLKLSGMLETLDARLAQAQGGDLGYLEFLQILCDDEITRREQVAMGRRLRRARFDGVLVRNVSPAANGGDHICST